jgi:hypothetical protein
MCRNIKILFNFAPPATDDEVRAVEEITMVSRRLLYSLETTAAPKNREEEAAKAKARSLARFAK